jgi:hypothetical protein
MLSLPDSNAEIAREKESEQNKNNSLIEKYFYTEKELIIK